MIYYTSDWHLGHVNILKMCHRPFDSIEEMNETIIQNYRNTVTDKDDVYFLGDLVFKYPDQPDKLWSSLPGRKHLIVGNHDKSLVSTGARYFVEITSYKKIKDDGRSAVLFHYPILEWDGFFRETYHLYGHIHNNKDNETSKIIGQMPRAFNVGVDDNNFRPVTLDELINKTT
jgi:calcineurin-like phosphoesterase family protein